MSSIFSEQYNDSGISGITPCGQTSQDKDLVGFSYISTSGEYSGKECVKFLKERVIAAGKELATAPQAANIKDFTKANPVPKQTEIGFKIIESHSDDESWEETVSKSPKKESNNLSL